MSDLPTWLMLVIEENSRGGGANHRWGASLLFWLIFPTTAWKWKHFWPRRGAPRWRPLGSTIGRTCKWWETQALNWFESHSCTLSRCSVKEALRLSGNQSSTEGHSQMSRNFLSNADSLVLREEQTEQLRLEITEKLNHNNLELHLLLQRLRSSQDLLFSSKGNKNCGFNSNPHFNYLQIILLTM